MDSTEMDTTAAEASIPINYIPKENSIDISSDKDGKLYKEILQEGEGDETPEDSNEVFVHYIGRLADGTEFDRSNRAGQPFSFMLGTGSVIRGWELGIATMKKNERALLVCHPDYAYGSRDQGKIPPNSTLYFEVELLYWKEEDLSKNKDGSILRKKLVPGENKYYNPNDGATVEIELEGHYQDKVFDKRTVTFVLGEGSDIGIPRGIEKALPKFSEKEKSRLTLQPKYAFGSEGHKEFGIPPNAVVSYIVHLKKLTKAKEPWQLNGSEKLEFSREFKVRGTQYFTEAKFRLANAQYKKIVDYLKVEAQLEGAEEEERKALLLAAYLNQAICYLKLEDHVNAKTNAEEALELDSKNVKGLFRLGQAYLALNEPEEARKRFQTVTELDPANKAASQQILACNKQIKIQKEREKKIFGNMFEKMARMDEQKENLRKKNATNGLDDLNEWEKTEEGTGKAQS